MARSIQEWYDILTTAQTSDPTLVGLTSTSAVAEHRLWRWVVAIAMNMLDKLLDFFKIDVLNLLATQRAHILQWYVVKAKAFQYGVILPADSDVYAVVPPVDPTVLIIAQAAAQELPSGRVRIKTATGSPLAALSSAQLAAFGAYMNRVKDAGVKLDITSGNADDMNLALTVYYDPLVLGSDGKRLDGTDDTPVKDAVKTFLEALPFNGLFVTNELLVAVRAVEGVRIPVVNTIESRYASMAFAPIAVEITPDAGYMRIVEAYFDMNVTYIAHDPLS